MAREYDLNDKSSLRREEPARAGDTDPKLSVSGCQQFLGEDLSFAHRARIQQQEQRLWNEEQIAAKQAAKNAVGDLDSTYAQRAMEIDAIKAQLESTAATGRKAQAVAVAEYQLAQARRHPSSPPPTHTPTPHAQARTPCTLHTCFATPASSHRLRTTRCTPRTPAPSTSSALPPAAPPRPGAHGSRRSSHRLRPGERQARARAGGPGHDATGQHRGDSKPPRKRPSMLNTPHPCLPAAMRPQLPMRPPTAPEALVLAQG